MGVYLFIAVPSLSVGSDESSKMRTPFLEQQIRKEYERRACARVREQLASTKVNNRGTGARRKFQRQREKRVVVISITKGESKESQPGDSSSYQAPLCPVTMEPLQ